MDPARDRDLELTVALGRRRLLRGGLGAAPIIATLASGPVAAGICTTGSAYGSMHPSGVRTSQTCGGRWPATWAGMNPSQWPINANALFSAYFAPALADAGAKLKNVVDPTKGYDPVASHCVCALLNASTSPALTPPTILNVGYAKTIWSSYASKGYFEPTAGVRWNGVQIVDWIKTTYA